MSVPAKQRGRSGWLFERAEDWPVRNRVEAEARERAAAERGRQAKALVEAHAPEIAPFIRALYAEGMIGGWRNVKVTVQEQDDGLAA